MWGCCELSVSRARRAGLQGARPPLPSCTDSALLYGRLLAELFCLHVRRPRRGVGVAVRWGGRCRLFVHVES